MGAAGRTSLGSPSWVLSTPRPGGPCEGATRMGRAEAQQLQLRALDPRCLGLDPSSTAYSCVTLGQLFPSLGLFPYLSTWVNNCT